MDSKTHNTLTVPLPASGLTTVDTPSVIEITEFVRKKLPQSDRKDTEDGLNWHLILDKQKGRKKKRPARKKALTRKERSALGLTRLPKDGWDHRKLTRTNEAWTAYVVAALNRPERLPGPDDPEHAAFCATLNKLELVGAEVTVVRSDVPSYVGLSGIVVMETKFTLQIVTGESKLKVLLKQSCVFQLHVNNWRFTMFGKHFITRPSERSVKKTKSYSISDL